MVLVEQAEQNLCQGTSHGDIFYYLIFQSYLSNLTGRNIVLMETKPLAFNSVSPAKRKFLSSLLQVFDFVSIWQIQYKRWLIIQADEIQAAEKKILSIHTLEGTLKDRKPQRSCFFKKVISSKFANAMLVKSVQRYVFQTILLLLEFLQPCAEERKGVGFSVVLIQL